LISSSEVFAISLEVWPHTAPGAMAAIAKKRTDILIVRCSTYKEDPVEFLFQMDFGTAGNDMNAVIAVIAGNR
jgi:hypothetical protein